MVPWLQWLHAWLQLCGLQPCRAVVIATVSNSDDDEQRGYARFAILAQRGTARAYRLEKRGSELGSLAWRIHHKRGARYVRATEPSGEVVWGGPSERPPIPKYLPVRGFPEFRSCLFLVDIVPHD